MRRHGYRQVRILFLVEGMVIYCRPGVYLPDQWGIRIEDTVLVRDGGCEVLTKMPKDFTIL